MLSETITLPSHIKDQENRFIVSLKNQLLKHIKEINQLSKRENQTFVFDDTPTEGSNNLITSGGIYTALKDVDVDIDVDDQITPDSNNPVTSAAIYTALQNLPDIYTREGMSEDILFSDTNGVSSGTINLSGNISDYDLIMFETNRSGQNNALNQNRNIFTASSLSELTGTGSLGNCILLTGYDNDYLKLTYISDNTLTAYESQYLKLLKIVGIKFGRYVSGVAVDDTVTQNSDAVVTSGAVYDALEDKADKSTTVSGYGITDVYTKTETDTKLNTKADKDSVYTKTETDDQINTKLAELVGQTPDTLDTLEELANALGKNPNFATTVTNLIGTKLTAGSADYIKSAAQYTNTLELKMGDNSKFLYTPNLPGAVSELYNDVGFIPYSELQAELADYATLNDLDDYLPLNGNAASATKLKNARNISVGDLDFIGSANFDGTGNIKLNATPYCAKITVSNKNNFPYHYIGTTGLIAANYTDKVITLLVTRDFVNGGAGVVRIEFRTNDATNNQVAQCRAVWLYRDTNLPIDTIQVGFRNTAKESIADIFYKSSCTYASAVVRTMANGSRGSINKAFTLIDSSEVTNTTTTDKLTSVGAYAAINDAVADLHSGKTYTSIITAVDNTSTGGMTFRWNHNTTDTYIPVKSSTYIDYVTKDDIISPCLKLTGGTMTGGITLHNSGSAITWKAPANISCTATANNQEWSFDLTPSTYTGTYAQFYSAKNSKTICGFYADDNSVKIPNGTLFPKQLTLDMSGTSPTVGTTIDIPFTYKTKTTASGNAIFETSPFFAFPTSETSNNGVGLGIGTGGAVVIGAGESGRNLVPNLKLNGGTENLYLSADGNINFYTNCNTIANSRVTSLNNNAEFLEYDKGITRGTNPPSDTGRWLVLKYDSANKALGGIYKYIASSGACVTRMYDYPHHNNTSGGQYLGIGHTSSGGVFTYAPTPTTSSNDTNIATTAFVKNQGYITSSGTATNVSGTVAIANGGTGATTRLNALKNLTNENVSTSAQYFLTITNAWGKGGYSSVDNVKTVLGLGSNAYNSTAFLPLAGGTMTGNINGNVSSFRIQNTISGNSGDLILCGGNGTSNGAYLQFNGKAHQNSTGGFFEIVATDGTNSSKLQARPNGLLQWKDKDIERVNAIGTNYIRYESGLQICWGVGTSATSGTSTITFPQSFSDVPFVIGTRASVNVNTTTEVVKTSNRTKTNFNLIITNGSSYYQADAHWIAIGKWK